ncbi:ribosome small subunit-dependent GTPase A [Streptomyces sp. NPDC057682]|uniref:ribosome small subunit-dependent GTPase A n=1 Tax=Streptomyces sp. NPDC057682 TaxID=3346210 RepID=UPI0036A869C6
MSSSFFTSSSSSDGAGSALAAFGWDEALDRDFTAHRADGLVPARIVRVDRGRCDVVTESGPVRAGSAAVSSPDPVLSPCTGDWAGLRTGSDPQLVALLPRRSVIVRSAAGRSSHGQALAANIDTVVVAVPLAAPPNPGRIERLLALAWDSGAVPVLALTKQDLADPSDADAAQSEVAALAPGVDTVVTSAATGAGLDILTALTHGTTVLLGPSGAGKSTLANALLGADVLATGAVRAQDGKGRHTTVHRELLPLPGGGVLIDTPGLRGIGLQDAADGLEQVFAEIEELAQECGFRDCGHDSEPGCAVRKAIRSGRLSERRLDSYRKLLRESDWAASRSDARMRAGRTDQQKSITRHLRATYRFRERRQ